MANESTVYQEILSQPDVWAASRKQLESSREALNELLFSQCWDAVFFTGCGSSYYLSLSAANLHQQLTGQRTRAVPASEMVFYPAGVYPDLPRQSVLLEAISRSGWTTETLRAVQQHHARELPVLAITCDGDSELALDGQALFSLEDAREKSVPQTRSFTSMYLATQYIAGVIAGEESFLADLQRLPALGRDVLSAAAQVVPEVAGANWDRAIFLGSGAYYGLACEAMLKLKEMSLSWSEAYHFSEFRHGPISLVDGRTLIVGLLSEAEAEAENALLEDVRGLGAQTLVIGEDLPGAEAVSSGIPLHSGLPELARGALYLLPLQLLAYERARVRSIDPDRPRHLQQTVMMEGI